MTPEGTLEAVGETSRLLAGIDSAVADEEVRHDLSSIGREAAQNSLKGS
jgi:hypothetical protein